MNPADISTWGNLVEIGGLKYGRSREISISGQSLPYCSLKNIYQLIGENGFCIESVILEVEPELPQRKVNDIRPKEQIAIVVSNENSLPEVLALRKDFPVVPHINLRPYDTPKSLCTYENVEEERVRFAPGRFLEDIRAWFSKTAIASLHQGDQPLEPFALTGNPRLMLPREIVTTAPDRLYRDVLIRKIEDASIITALVCHATAEIKPQPNELLFRLVNITVSPQDQSTIRREPKRFGDLRLLLEEKGINLLTVVRESLGNIVDINPPNRRPDSLVILLHIPRLRNKKSDPEDIETWAFWLRPDIKELGTRFGLWQIQQNEIGRLIPIDENAIGENVDVVSLNTCIAFDQKLACSTSGYQSYPQLKIVLVGCGAIGSQVFMNIARMGIGKWVLIDDDMILPHNFARHASFPGFEGMNKAEVLSIISAGLLPNGGIQYLRGKVSGTTELTPEIIRVLNDADVIIDATTSIAASRFLSTYAESKARRLSIFLNPRGTDAVLLLENKDRTISLDTLEMQYYRTICEYDQLQHHLEKPSGGLRYSNSCRDFSFILPQSQVATLSGILSGAILQSLQQDEALISFWQLDPKNWSVSNMKMRGQQTRLIDAEGWTVKIDDGFLEKIKMTRLSRLPNETGGVILGMFDTSRKIIYVVDTVLSPVDSVERVTSYIRGKQGLKEEIEKIRVRTLGQLEYLGEWHSHPRHATSDPSTLDYDVLAWIGDNMQPFGLPGIVVIVADDAQFSLLKIQTSTQNYPALTTVSHMEFEENIVDIGN